VVFALVNGISPALSWLWMLPIVLGFIALALGFGMFLSAMFVRFRDVQPIWDVVSQILFYVTPIMYPAYDFHRFEHIALLSPFATLMTQVGSSFLHMGPVTRIVDGRPELHYYFRSATTAAGGIGHVLIAIAFIPLIVAVGAWFFVREAPRVAENL
jgi:ABC-2 type transport system permease protein